jgi:hypothetical protein
VGRRQQKCGDAAKIDWFAEKYDWFRDIKSAKIAGSLFSWNSREVFV